VDKYVTATNICDTYPVSRTTLRRLLDKNQPPEVRFPEPKRLSPRGKRLWSMDEVAEYFARRIGNGSPSLPNAQADSIHAA
jgi:hypothetical protein